MGELTEVKNNLPDNIEDMAEYHSKYALFTRAKLRAVKEMLSKPNIDINSYDYQVAKEEAQGAAEKMLIIECEYGKMLQAIKTRQGGDHGNQYTGGKKQNDNFGKPLPAEEFGILPPQTKAQQIAELGLSKQQAEKMQTLAKNPEIVKQAIEEARNNDDIVSRSLVLNMIRQEKKEQIKADKSKNKLYQKPTNLPDSCNLFVADINDGLPQIADNSIDFIITDPPYPREFLNVYKSLSKVANRVLREGGSMLVMCGQSYLNQVIKMLDDEGLNYHWTLSYLTPGGQSPMLWQKKTNTFWKPILWYTKGKYNGDYIGDVIKAGVNANDKEYHKWGQNVIGFTEIVQKFTYPKQVVLDPFLGGGTTGIVCVSMDRTFIGCDVSDECIQTSTKRIMEHICNEPE